MVIPRKAWQKIFIIGLVCVIAYFVTRLFNLTALPIFTDEAIYIRWSQIGSRDAAWRFISLVDGKQPMFTWVMMVILKIVDDPLFAGRLVSVLSGFGTLVGVWVLSWELFGVRRVSVIAAALYLMSPFFLMYDRLALYDSMVAMFSVWSLYLGVLLARRVRLDIALILGMVLGGGMLNKTSGFLSLYLLPFTLVLFDWKTSKSKQRLLVWVGLACVAAVLSQVIYNLLRLSPLFHMVKLKDAVFIYPLSDWIRHPFTYFVGNIKGLFDWLTHYLTWPIYLAAIAPALFFWKIWKEKLLLYAWWLAPFVGLALFGKVLYPRFILFMTIPLLLLSAVTISYILSRWKRTLWGIVFATIMVVPSIYMDYFILTNPLYAPIPYSDKSQLIDDWPSGWGIAQVNAFLTAEARKGKVSIYTDGTFGLLPYAIEIYQVDNPNVKIHGIWPIPKVIPNTMLNDARNHPTYMVFNQQQAIPDWPMEFIAEYQKGNRVGVKMRLFRILPTPLNYAQKK